METVKKGDRFRDADCGCTLVASLGGDSTLVSCDRFQCPSSAVRTHVYIDRYRDTRIAEAPAAPVMAATSNGRPALCMACGGDKDGFGLMCLPCWSDHHLVALEWWKEWQAGARDFPRAKPESTPPEVLYGERVRITESINPGVVHVVTLPPPPTGFYGRGIGEMLRGAELPESAVLTGPVDWSSGPAIRQRVEIAERRLRGELPPDPMKHMPPKPATCGHPGPHGYGGKCFPCHAEADANAALLTRCGETTVRDDSLPVEPRPAVQSHNLGAGIGVWGLRGPR